MTQLSRRAAVSGSFAALLFGSACSNGVGSSGAAEIDARVDAALRFLDNNYPATRQLQQKSVGMLVMPRIAEGGLGFGASWGRGALRINGATVDYYSAASASFGLQIGGQVYSHVLYFMTDEALADFRAASGWVAGGDIQYTVSDQGETLSADTITALAPVVAVVFGKAGLIVGATVKGTKYTRIIPQESVF